MKPEILNLMTVQEAMDFAIGKLVEQGDRCMFNGGCAYGDGNGNHCGIGWLLDETDENLMSGERVIDEIIGMPDIKIPELITSNLYKFMLFQRFHDETRERSYYLRKLCEVGIDVSGPNWEAWVKLGEQEGDLK